MLDAVPPRCPDSLPPRCPDSTVLLLSTSDTDLITARAAGVGYRWANPSRLVDGELEELLRDSDIAVVRILGGYRAWQDGIDTVVASGVPTVVVSGEQSPDAELMGRSTTPAGVALQSHIYLAQGGVDNLRQLHAFLCDTLLMTGFGFSPPVTTPNWGILERASTRDDGPTIAVLYYRAQHLAGNTDLRRGAVPGHRGGGRPGPTGVLRIAAHRRGRTARRAAHRRRDGDHRAGGRGIDPGDRERRWRRRLLECGTPGHPGHTDPAGPVPDQFARAVGRPTTTGCLRSTWPPRSPCPNSTAASSRFRSRSRRSTTRG